MIIKCTIQALLCASLGVGNAHLGLGRDRQRRLNLFPRVITHGLPIRAVPNMIQLALALPPTVT